MTLAIAVCVKPVPSEESAAKVKIDPHSKALIRSEAQPVLNAADKNALEAALQIREQAADARLDVFAMAAPDTEICLREALAMGADQAYLLTDRAFAGGDSLATARTLAAGINKCGPYDLILCGSHSSDSGTAQVPAQIGELLHLPHLHRVAELTYEAGSLLLTCVLDGGYYKWRAQLPLLLSTKETLNKPRYTNVRGIMKAQKKPLTRLNAADLAIDTSLVGLNGSPSQSGETYAFSSQRDGKVLSGDTNDLVRQLCEILERAGRVIQHTEGV